MPRPTNKDELLKLSDLNARKLIDFINLLPEGLRFREFSDGELNDRDRTIADVICHLHEWHEMMASWYAVGMAGKKPAIPAEDVTWKTLPVLNRRIYEKYKGTKLEKAIALFEKSKQTITGLIQKHSDEELFTKKKYDWTGSTSLGAYFVSNTSSHYDWALKTIKRAKK